MRRPVSRWNFGVHDVSWIVVGYLDVLHFREKSVHLRPSDFERLEFRQANCPTAWMTIPFKYWYVFDLTLQSYTIRILGEKCKRCVHVGRSPIVHVRIGSGGEQERRQHAYDIKTPFTRCSVCNELIVRTVQKYSSRCAFSLFRIWWPQSSCSSSICNC